MFGCGLMTVDICCTAWAGRERVSGGGSCFHFPCKSHPSCFVYTPPIQSLKTM